jgi:hypothetical protein
MQATRARSAASARNRRRRVLILAGPFLGPSGREFPERLNREGLSTVAGRAGGPVRSSGEALVTGAERRGRVARD